jgi:hypothetical protein
MNHQDDMDGMFDKLEDLTDHQRASIKHRYRFLMNEYRQRAFYYSIIFYLLRTTMTVGSLAVPALLSLQTDTSDLYWFTWGLSLAVTTANGITTLFKVETRYLTLHTTMENLRTETWQYLELAGRYSGHHGHEKPTYKNQYVYYCSRIEKIRMKQVGEEFVKHTDTETQQGPGRAQPPQSTSVVLSPADQALNKTRRESHHTTGDDSVIELVESDQKNTSVSVQDSNGALPQNRKREVPVLPRSPTV